jgi:hypothetical protein
MEILYISFDMGENTLGDGTKSASIHTYAKPSPKSQAYKRWILTYVNAVTWHFDK